MHAYYIGYKFQKGMRRNPRSASGTSDYAYELLYTLYENEIEYTQDLYDAVGLTGDVKKYLRYNANKALMNLGFEALFPARRDRRQPGDPLRALTNADENHDFFSGSGSSYVIGKAVVTEDEDWDSKGPVQFTAPRVTRGPGVLR